MADEKPADWKQKYGPLIWYVVNRLAILALGALAAWLGIPTEKVEKVIQVPVPMLDDGEHGQGWLRDPDAIEENADPDRTLQFDATPAGRAVMGGDADVMLWRAVRKAGNLPADRYPNVDQQNVGCCVGCGWKHGVDVLMAVQIANGMRHEFKPVSVEVIYGGSRVEVGGGRVRGDGSVGAWAAKWCADYGVVPMGKYPAADLTTFSPARARQFGKSGVPDALEPLARQHPVKGTALVKTWADVKRAVGQMYPVVVCSDVGFDNRDGTVGTRDADGFIKPRGVWNHCMVIVGVRGGARPGGFILNSWGDAAHRGPVWPADAPKAGFWADADTIDRMVRQGDSFALSDLQGFPARDLPLDWFIHARPRRDRNPFALDRAEVALSW